MFHSLRQIFGDKHLLVYALMIFVQASAIGATIPYISVTAINELGMTDRGFSLLVFAASSAAVSIGVSLGILSDMVGDRRSILMGMGLFGAFGYGIIVFFPTVAVFVLATICVIPFFQSVSSLLFAGARAETARFDPADAASIGTTIRAFMSAAWVVMPAAMGFALANSKSMLGAWSVAGLCALSIFLSAAFLLPKKIKVQVDAKSGPGFFASLKELASPMMLMRALSMAALTGTVRLSSTVWPLILTVNLGGSNADVGVIAGLIALFEIPFMLGWAELLRRYPMVPMLVAAGLIYAAFLAALAFASQTWHLYALTVPGAAGAAALLSLPLTYFQDLFPGRPGLGTAFYPINGFLGNAMTALAFATGAHFLGYSGTPWLGVAMTLAGIAGLLAVQRRAKVSA
jgi:MFS transporter, SET family, sugar efflux transporter